MPNICKCSQIELKCSDMNGFNLGLIFIRCNVSAYSAFWFDSWVIFYSVTLITMRYSYRLTHDEKDETVYLSLLTIFSLVFDKLKGFLRVWKTDINVDICVV